MLATIFQNENLEIHSQLKTSNFYGAYFQLTFPTTRMPQNQFDSVPTLTFLEIDASTDINLQSMAITLSLIMGIMIMCATFTVAPVIERTNGVTALQHCSGSPVWIDWLARYIWDFCNIFPAFITITIILFASRNVAGLSSLTENYELFTVLFIARVLDTTSGFISPLPVKSFLSGTR